MVDYEMMVHNFMIKHNQARISLGECPAHEVGILRMRLMMEELGEVAQALHKYHTMWQFPMAWVPLEERNQKVLDILVELADGLADLIYVVVGTAIAYGIPINEVFAEVQRSNMTKGTLDATQKGGKVEKDVMFEPPQIREILQEKLSSSL